MVQSAVFPERKIHITIPDCKTLAQAWMPFVKNGGLFVPTQGEALLGDELLLVVELPEESQPIRVLGAIVWLSPPAADSGKTSGWGIQFSERDKGQTRRQIEAYLQRSGAPIPAMASTYTL